MKKKMSNSNRTLFQVYSLQLPFSFRLQLSVIMTLPSVRSFHTSFSLYADFDPTRDHFDERDGSRLDPIQGILIVNETRGEAQEYFDAKANSIRSHFNTAISQANSVGASQSDINNLVSNRDNLLVGLEEQREMISDALLSSGVPSDASNTSGEQSTSAAGENSPAGGNGGRGSPPLPPSPGAGDGSSSGSSGFQDSTGISGDVDMPDHFGDE